MRDLINGTLHADHVVPVKEGGTTTIANGELMFAADNLAKGAQSNEPHFAFQEDQEEE